MKYEKSDPKENNYTWSRKRETSRQQSRIWGRARCADDGFPLLEVDCRRDVLQACTSGRGVYNSAVDARISRPWVPALPTQSNGRNAYSVYTGLLALRQACHVVVHLTLMLFDVSLNMYYGTANYGCAPMAC